MSHSVRHEEMYPQVPANSVAVDRPRVLVIQPGDELECAMTRGWIDALCATADIEIVAQFAYSELLDIMPNPTTYHALPHNPFELVRVRRRLKVQNFDYVLVLNDTLAGRFLASVYPVEKRIQSQVGPPTRPSEIDAVLAVLFGRLGVEKPTRSEALQLTRGTQRAANELLIEFGFTADQRPPMVAPQSGPEDALSSSWRTAQTFTGAVLPVILLPAGQEIEFIGALVGKAFLVPSPGLALRAALIQRASTLLSNHLPSIELAELMHTPVTELHRNQNA